MQIGKGRVSLVVVWRARSPECAGGLGMSEREQTGKLKGEMRRLNASPLLCKMVHIIYQVNGYDAALRCLNDGVAQGI